MFKAKIYLYSLTLLPCTVMVIFVAAKNVIKIEKANEGDEGDYNLK